MGNNNNIGGGWHPPMKWDPKNIPGSWQKVCMFLNLQDPFMGSALWQAGPMPWLGLFSSWNNNSIFPSWNQAVQTPVGDTLETTPTTAAPATTEEAPINQEEKDKANYKKKQLEKKFNNLKEVMNDFKSNLDEDNEDQYLLKQKIEKFTKNATESNYNALLAIYNTNQDVVKNAQKAKAEKELTSTNNTKLSSEITNLQSAIKNEKDFKILNADGDLDSDYKILELLSTWNSNETTKTTHIMQEIGNKYKTLTDGTQKSKYETLTKALQDELLDEAENFKGTISTTTKTALENAIEKLEEFDDMNKRFPNSETNCGENYSKAFDNLYRLLRIAEAENADNKLKAKFSFLGDANPYKTATLVNGVKADLEAEGLEEELESTVPTPSGEAPTPTPNAGISTTSDTASPIAPDATTGEINTLSSVDTSKAPKAKSVSNAIGKDYENGTSLGDALYRALNTFGEGQTIRKIIKYDINKNNIIGLIDGFNKKLEEKDENNENIIKYLADDNFNVDMCNRVVKAVMRRAYDAGLNETNSKAYATLVDYFQIKGKPEYKEDNLTPKENDFSITKRDNSYYNDNVEKTTIKTTINGSIRTIGNTYETEVKINEKNETRIYNSDKHIYKKETANKIWEMLNNLINEIKNINKSS